MNNSMNYYELLGVEKNASTEEIKAAYKKQMKKWHPDINKSENAVNMSSKINEAKEVLLNETKRKDYDNYLNNKVNEDYNKYTQRKEQAENSKQNNNNYQNDYVTKWQYLNDWLNYANESFTRKIIGLFGVLLESLLCFILKYLIIIIAFFIFFVCDLVKTLYSYISLLILIFSFYLIIIYANEGLHSLITNHSSEFNSMLIIILIYISTFILPILGQKLISPEVFNFLYNKLDIYLFKLAVGYKK